jgi:hypothetical protein
MEGSELSIVALLVAVLVACLVYWAPTRIMAAFGVGDPIRTVVIWSSSCCYASGCWACSGCGCRLGFCGSDA